MQFQLKTIKREGHLDFDQTTKLPRISETLVDVSRTSDERVAGTITYANPLILIEGIVTATITYVCSRCLSEFERPFKTRLTATYTTDDAETDDDIPLLSTDIIDITENVEEAMFLSLDDRPLCRPDCRGLCPECGVNRNDETCHCETKPIDPRLAALKDLLSDSDSE